MFDEQDNILCESKEQIVDSDSDNEESDDDSDDENIVQKGGNNDMYYDYIKYKLKYLLLKYDLM